jgi:hypothetical protein
MKKNVFKMLAVASVIFGLSSCDKDKCEDVTCPAGYTCNDGTCVSDGTISDDVIVVTSNISADTRWTSDKVYQLGGRITVLSGVTLTIDAGTVIKGEAGNGANATALLVARGGMIEAVGTASLPIIFTSVADEITPEDVAMMMVGLKVARYASKSGFQPDTWIDIAGYAGCGYEVGSVEKT